MSKKTKELSDLARNAFRQKLVEIRESGWDFKPEDREHIGLEWGPREHGVNDQKYRFLLVRAMKVSYEGFEVMECEGDLESMTIYNMVVHWEHFAKVDPDD